MDPTSLESPTIQTFATPASSEPDGATSGQIGFELAGDAATTRDYIFLLVTSCLLASFGLLADSTAVVIGAMLVAPLMMPIRAMAFGALRGDAKLFTTAVSSVTVGVGLAISLSALVSMAVRLPSLGVESLARTQPTLLDLGVAIVAGAVCAYAKVRPRIGDSVAGTAIAVALMPPLCTVGLSMAVGEMESSIGALLLFLTNLLGITLACMGVFAVYGYGKQFRRSGQALGLTGVLTAMLVVPLTYSMVNLVAQARLVALINLLLTTRTVTVGQHMELVKTQVNWSGPRPEVRLLVRALQTPSPNQVELLETFVLQETGTRFRLVFEVSKLEVVEARPSLPPLGATIGPARLEDGAPPVR